MDRHGSRKVPTAPWREGTFFTICGVAAYFWIQVPGGKQDSGIRFVLISLEQLLQAIPIDAIFDACCKYCCLLQSTAFTFAALWDFWMQISGDKTIQFLTQQIQQIHVC